MNKPKGSRTEIHIRPFLCSRDEFGNKRKGYFVTVYRLGRKVKKGLAFTWAMAEALVENYKEHATDIVTLHKVAYRPWKRR